MRLCPWSGDINALINDEKESVTLLFVFWGFSLSWWQIFYFCVFWSLAPSGDDFVFSFSHDYSFWKIVKLAFLNEKNLHVSSKFHENFINFYQISVKTWKFGNTVRFSIKMSLLFILQKHFTRTIKWKMINTRLPHKLQQKYFGTFAVNNTINSNSFNLTLNSLPHTQALSTKNIWETFT